MTKFDDSAAADGMGKAIESAMVAKIKKDGGMKGN